MVRAAIIATLLATSAQADEFAPILPPLADIRAGAFLCDERPQLVQALTGPTARVPGCGRLMRGVRGVVMVHDGHVDVGLFRVYIARLTKGDQSQWMPVKSVPLSKILGRGA